MSDPPQDQLPRVLVLAAWLVGLLALALALWQGWSLTLRVDGLPSYDAADYLNRALELHQVDAPWSAALEPDVHPPGYPVVLAVWMALAGTSVLSASLLSALLVIASMALVVVLGGLVGGPHGRLVGLGAAVATMMSIEHQRLVAAPMTEPLALLATALFLVVAVLALERRGWALDLAVGLVVLGATLVRYNLGPMFVVPLAVVHGLRFFRHPREALDWRPLLWVLPTLVFFALWWLLEPRLAESIRTFVVNVDTGIRTWSRENLVWLPYAFAKDYTGLVAPAVVAGIAFAATAVWAFVPDRAARRSERARQGLRLVALFTLVGVVAVWVHPFKVSRAMHPLVPYVFLVAGVGVVRLGALIRGRPGWLAGAALVAAGGWWFAGARALLSEPGAHGRLEFIDMASFGEELDRVTGLAVGRSEVVITGEHLLVAPVVVEYLVRSASPRTAVVRESRAPEWCTPESDAPDCLASPHSIELLASQPPSSDWMVLTIEKTAPRHAQRGRGQPVHWSRASAAGIGAAAAEAGVPTLVEVESKRRRVRIAAYGWPAR